MGYLPKTTKNRHTMNRLILPLKQVPIQTSFIPFLFKHMNLSLVNPIDSD